MKHFKHKAKRPVRCISRHPSPTFNNQHSNIFISSLYLIYFLLKFRVNLWHFTHKYLGLCLFKRGHFSHITIIPLSFLTQLTVIPSYHLVHIEIFSLVQKMSFRAGLSIQGLIKDYVVLRHMSLNIPLLWYNSLSLFCDLIYWRNTASYLIKCSICMCFSSWCCLTCSFSPQISYKLQFRSKGLIRF